MKTTALQQLTIFIAHRLVVQIVVYSGEQVVKRCALRAVWVETGFTSQLISHQPSQAKVLTGCGDLREAQVDVPLCVSRSCI
jgi:hypothetical protein